MLQSAGCFIVLELQCTSILRKCGLKAAFCSESSRGLNFFIRPLFCHPLVTKIFNFMLTEMFNAMENTRKLLWLVICSMTKSDGVEIVQCQRVSFLIGTNLYLQTSSFFHNVTSFVNSKLAFTFTKSFFSGCHVGVLERVRHHHGRRMHFSLKNSRVYFPISML